MKNITSKSIILGVVAALAGVFFPHSAYATSYINVSSGSGGTISFGSIKPTSTGTSATASDTLTVHTDCSAGYSVYVSGQSGKDTNLTNKSAESDNVISTSSNAIGSAGSLGTNTWGLNSENTGAYVGLPTYDDALTTALTTKSNVAESSTVDIYYGLKVNTALTPGTYTGDVLYTVVSNPNCATYTVRFNANGGTGTMNNQTINIGEAANLSMNTFTRSGYAFRGWSTDASAAIPTYLDGASVTDISSFNTTLDLYAVWTQASGTMQSWTSCPSLTTGQSVFLTDTRDNKVYAVKKLPDGKCWMVQNLTIGMDGAKTLTPADTNIDDGKTYYLPPAGKQGSSTIDDPSTLTATETVDFANVSNTDPHAKTQFRTKDSSIINDSDTGYYNFYTATLGFSRHGDGVGIGSSTRDICPKGWRLPKVTDGSTINTIGIANDLTNLARSYSTDDWSGTITSYDYHTTNPIAMDSIGESVASPLATIAQNNYAGFSRSGVMGPSGMAYTDMGFYWSSSISGNRGYLLSYSSTATYPQYYYSKTNGVAVRCLAQNKYTINYSNSGATSGNPSKTTDGTQHDNTTLTLPTVGNMVKSGYAFKGWAFTSGATTVAYNPGASVSVISLAAAASSAGQTVSPGSTITLYPVWEKQIAYMQTTSCSSLTTGATTTLVDSRDNQSYTVYRWPSSGTAGTSYPTSMAGYCIMTKDLSLGYVTGGSITKGTNLTLTTATSAAAGTITARTGASDWNTENVDTNLQYINGPSTIYSVHAYYSYGATQKVCPKSWRPPTKTEYDNMVTFMGGNSSTGTNKIRGEPYNFDYGGYFDSGGWHGVSSDGRYWSSTQYSSTRGYYLGFVSLGGLYTHDYDGNSKYTGRSVRCVAAP